MGGPGSGPVLIAGKRYPNSFAVSACTVFSTQPTYAFDVADRYRRMTGVVGQDDGSASQDAVLHLTVRGDGKQLASRTVRYGKASPLSVDISGVKRLTLSFTEKSCGADGAALALGKARVE